MTFVLFCIVLYIFAFYNFDNANYFVLFLYFVLSGYFKTMSVYDFKNQNEDLKKKKNKHKFIDTHCRLVAARGGRWRMGGEQNG